MYNFKIGYRWRICALLLVATTINYLDRSVLSILAPDLQEEFGWSELDYSRIVNAFQLAYAFSVIGMGKLLDHYGIRIIYSIGVGFWSLAGMGHAFARSVAGFSIARFGLGIGEGVNFPAAIKTIAEWFPEHERAKAVGIFNAGSSIGAIAAPLLVPVIAFYLGWQWCFIITGMFGFVWLILWLKTYRKPEEHPGLSKEELDLIRKNAKSQQKDSLPIRKVIFKRETLLIASVRFITEPMWWFLLFWLPKFLNENYGITLMNIGLPMVTIYLIADIGSVSGGWFSSYLIKKKKGVNYARKAAMLVCALCAIPIITVPYLSNYYIVIGLISLGAAAHMGWMANVFSVISDMYSQKAIGTVTGISTTIGILGAMFFSFFIGIILEKTGSYSLIFSIAGITYIAGWIVLVWGIPRIEPVKI